MKRFLATMMAVLMTVACTACTNEAVEQETETVAISETTEATEVPIATGTSEILLETEEESEVESEEESEEETEDETEEESEEETEEETEEEEETESATTTATQTKTKSETTTSTAQTKVYTIIVTDSTTKKSTTTTTTTKKTTTTTTKKTSTTSSYDLDESVVYTDNYILKMAQGDDAVAFIKANDGKHFTIDLQLTEEETLYYINYAIDYAKSLGIVCYTTLDEWSTSHIIRDLDWYLSIEFTENVTDMNWTASTKYRSDSTWKSEIESIVNNFYKVNVAPVDGDGIWMQAWTVLGDCSDNPTFYATDKYGYNYSFSCEVLQTNIYVGWVEMWDYDPWEDGYILL